MVSVLSAIEQLIQRRADLLQEVAAIESELERAQVALSGDVRAVRVALRGHRNDKRDRRPDGSLPNMIVASLAAKEPRTLNDIAAYIQRKSPTVYVALREMVMAGQLFRVRASGQGSPNIYARSESVLREYAAAPRIGARQPADAPSSGDDELGQDIPVPPDGGSSLSARDGAL